VEDNIVNQKVISRLLSQRGYQFQIANNGAEAVEKVKSGPQQFAAILMDVQMPVMDGLTATIRIREMEAAAREKAAASDTDAEERTPIIGLTAGAMVEDKEKCLAAGMDDYLSKPVSRECLLNALLRWTQATQRRRQQQQQTVGDEVEDSDDEAEPPPPPPGRPTSRGRAL
jgi:CheY-like chemotaxis protein